MTFAELAAFAGRHPMLSLALAGITIALIANEIASLLSGVRRVGPAQLTGLINRDNALVVDLRPAAEFEKAGVKDVEASKAEFIADGRMPAVRESIRRSKAVDYLVENAKVTEVDETAKDAE